MHIDISIQDDKHYGLKCVDLVNNFVLQYKSLKSLVLVTYIFFNTTHNIIIIYRLTIRIFFTKNIFNFLN